ncbi:MAG: transposase, partial [Bacteriovoracaceae bacterium]|nr:transposase [Bacteriovoracaceae bacterium]
GLTIFLNDPMIPLDNNTAERALRNPVKGRDNYNGYMSINGADTAMTLCVAQHKIVYVELIIMLRKYQFLSLNPVKIR